MKPSTAVTDSSRIEVLQPGPQWVGRAATKLAAAIEGFGPLGLQVAGRRCLDVGASTGGFTQVLLHHGAERVIALDVGHGQLAPEVARDERVEDRSGTTVRGLTADDIGGPVELLVADLSFISLTMVLPELAGLLAPGGDAVVLVKPQFEVGRTRLGKNGVVRSAGDRAWAITECVRAAIDVDLWPRGLARSPIQGASGNAEYLLWLAGRAPSSLGWEAVVALADALSLDGEP